MPRRLLFFLLVLTLVLSACKPADKTGTATVGADKATQPAAAQTTAPTTVSKEAPTLALPDQAPSVPGCKTVSFIPTPDPSSLFPAITEEDHYRGSLNATVKIVEYSDFQ